MSRLTHVLIHDQTKAQTARPIDVKFGTYIHFLRPLRPRFSIRKCFNKYRRVVILTFKTHFLSSFTVVSPKPLITLK